MPFGLQFVGFLGNRVTCGDRVELVALARHDYPGIVTAHDCCGGLDDFFEGFFQICLVVQLEGQTGKRIGLGIHRWRLQRFRREAGAPVPQRVVVLC
jgi:hypothetical protein